MSRSVLSLLMAVMLEVMVGCRTNESPEGQVKDAGLAASIKEKLVANINATTLTNVSVNVTNGVVTLSGQVNTADNKQRAEEIARGVHGVVRVNDDLQVLSQ